MNSALNVVNKNIIECTYFIFFLIKLKPHLSVYFNSVQVKSKNSTYFSDSKKSDSLVIECRMFTFCNYTFSK